LRSLDEVLRDKESITAAVSASWARIYTEAQISARIGLGFSLTKVEFDCSKQNGPQLISCSRCPTSSRAVCWLAFWLDQEAQDAELAYFLSRACMGWLWGPKSVAWLSHPERTAEKPSYLVAYSGPGTLILACSGLLFLSGAAKNG
jgi:hypothetical protein